MSGKKIDYLPSPLLHSLQSHGIASVADYKERLCQDQQNNMEELVAFVQESTGALQISEFIFDHANCSQI
jgi:hypothetical protein